MRVVVTTIAAMTCLAAMASAQGQPSTTASVGFHNQSDFTVIIKGYTIVNGVQRAGPVVTLKKGSKAYENNVPTGIRYYTIYDANRPQQVLLQNHAVDVRGGIVSLRIMNSPNHANRVILVPAAAPSP